MNNRMGGIYGVSGRQARYKQDSVFPHFGVIWGTGWISERLSGPPKY